VQVAGSLSGGHRYGEAARRAVQRSSPVDLVDIRSNAGPLKPLVMQARLARLRSRGGYEMLVLDNVATLALPMPSRPRHLVVVYHIGLESIANPWERALLGAIEPLCLRRLRDADHVVTISKFWEARVRALGVSRVTTIPFGFGLVDQAEVANPARVAELRARFGLTKPIVYIGNCQPAKGVRESYEALCGLDVHLVTSGRPAIDLPALNLELSYADYLTLLAASSAVVTMSKFDEGWCITAHEAMLLGRPVIGSGRGGMRELLEGGDQIVCPRFEDLQAHVVAILEQPEAARARAEAGRAFARTFTTERFERAWVALLAQLSEAPAPR
jgi:glycosyltransferase involved in cell wall biosynthesis